jgi:hypothetical protein
MGDYAWEMKIKTILTAHLAVARYFTYCAKSKKYEQQYSYGIFIQTEHYSYRQYSGAALRIYK